MNDSLFQAALRLHQAGNLSEAARLYGQILRAEPRHFQALYLLGFVHSQSGDFAEAERLIGQALGLNPGSPDAWYNRGCALQNLNRHKDALDCFDRAISLNPRYDEALTNRGVTLSALKRQVEALASLDAALALKPGDVEALSGRGNALLALGRNDEAFADFDRASQLAPDRAESWLNRGAMLVRMKRHEEALTCYEHALMLNPSYERAQINRSLALLDLKRPDEALASYDAALAVNPRSADLRSARADALLALRRHEEAARDYGAVLGFDPDYRYARGNLAFCKLHCCDWRSLDDERTALAAGLRAGRAVINPFQNIALSQSSSEQLQCARIAVAEKYPAAANSLWRGERYDHERIRLAYLSADFNDHAVSTLMAGVFEHHDRTKLETIAIAFLKDDTTAARRRLKPAFDRFIEVQDKSDVEVAQLLRQLEVDIAVDLMGFTGECRPGILAFRPAPVQVNYLGFPGTMGADYIDAIIADRTVIPEESLDHYSEAVVCLPDSYLPNDASRRIAERTPSRSEAGLPEKGFVFCSFNNSYKFTPELFDIWMRLLSRVEDSVLWLPEVNGAAVRNLRREAAARGIDEKRLVFAPFLASAEDHLARLRLADLFLDTLPYNAHTTAADALWAGLPVLTTPGNTFAGRVAASLLKAIGLPEMIAPSLEAYEAMALQLARDANALAGIRAKLQRNRDTHALFDTARFTRNLEAAYARLYEPTPLNPTAGS